MQVSILRQPARLFLLDFPIWPGCATIEATTFTDNSSKPNCDHSMTMGMYSRSRSHCADEPLAPRQALFVLVVLLSALLLLTGCRNRTTGNPEEPDLLATLPTDWIVAPINGNTWTPVDIDDDQGQVEYLLLYTYNNQNPDGTTSSGPAGASIFDLQNNSELVPEARAVSMPYQPSGTYVPYRILPNYWQGSDTGYIAPIGRQDKVTVATIDRNQERDVIVSVETAGGASTPSSEPSDEADLAIDVETKTVPVKELLIEDDGQTITVVWWRNMIDGYGVANAYAAAGFQDRRYEQEGQSTTPLVQFSGFHPFNDRSVLCYVSLYTREYLTQTVMIDSVETIVPTVDFRFEESPRGIQFCGANPPATPFYPEAVVLKYLFDPESEETLLDLDEVNKAEVADKLSESVRNETQRIQGLYGPSLIRFDNVDDSPATVCLALIDQTNGEQSAFRFRLNHVKPDVEARTTDQFKITNIRPIPAPANGPEVDCNRIVNDGTPGRIPVP
jgi:hypothetical protein